MHVIVDDREPREGVAECLRRMEDVTVAVERLCAGDYLVDRRVLFERKALRDFAVSLVDGRLFKQALGLKRSGFRPVFIIEGTARDLTGCDVRREAMQGALITLQVVLDIPVLRSMSPEETATLIRYAAQQMDRRAHGGLYRPGTRPRGKRARQLYILQSLPGVGPTRAARLLDTFGNVESVFVADEETLADTAGIGRTTAAAIRNAVREERAEWGRS